MSGADRDRCEAIRSRHVAPGWGCWGCCGCSSYNGDHFPKCKGCGHDRCDGYEPTATDKELRKAIEEDGAPTKRVRDLFSRQIDESRETASR